METGSILEADLLDILFDKRNKAYGAYDLRRNYPRHLRKALAFTFTVAVLVCLTYLLFGSKESHEPDLVLSNTFSIAPADPLIKPAEHLIPPKAVAQQQVTSDVYRIVKDIDVKDAENPLPDAPATNQGLGPLSTDATGQPDGIEAPVSAGSGLTNLQHKTEADDSIFRTVEIDAQYPGGPEAWRVFLTRKLNYPQQAIDNRIQGTVLVQFIVDREGNVSDVTVQSGPPELFEAAVQVIRKSGKWQAAIQNGRSVKAYKVQPITFRLGDD